MWRAGCDVSTDLQEKHDAGKRLAERVARLEGMMERVVDELGTLRQEMREEFRESRRQATHDFRMLLGVIASVAVGLAALSVGLATSIVRQLPG